MRSAHTIPNPQSKDPEPLNIELLNGYVSGISAGHIVMSEIYFFRHGQASFGEENYDRLSPLGVRQAQVLARYLAKAGKVFDAVYYGEMERQQKTARRPESLPKGLLSGDGSLGKR